MNRIDRLSAILIMLQSSSSVRTKQVAGRFCISSRTVYRDIRALEEAGIPIVGNAREGYSLVEGFKLPPLMFTQEEAFTFLAAERLVERFTDSGFKEGYRTGIGKIRAVMRLAEKDKMENLDTQIDSLDFHFYESHHPQNILQTLMNEISKRRKICITYFSYNVQESTNREVDPIGIFFSLSSWYLVAFCHKKKDYRTFRVSRIQEITPTNECFEIEHPPFNSFLKSLSDKENLMEVIIEVSKKEFSLIDESKYYQGLIREKQIEENMELHFMVFSIERFARWYMSFIDIAKIIYPKELELSVEGILQRAKINRNN